MIHLLWLLAVGLGAPAQLSGISTAEEFDVVAKPSRDRADIVSATKYIVPATADPRLLPTTYQNVNVYPFHIEFLAAEFPERFPDLTTSEYRRLVEQRATREYFAGVLFRLAPEAGGVLYGFMFYTDQASQSELPRPEEVEYVYRKLSDTFTAGPLAYAPVRRDVIEVARGWEETPFPVYLPDLGILGSFRAYTTGTAYGRLRVVSLRELLEAGDAGELTWRDIVAVDEAPQDLTAPVAALIGGTPQTELSHLSLRLAQRRTPHAYLADVVSELEPFEGTLVRIDVTDRAVSVTPVDDPAEAEEWWETHRPRLPTLPAFDVEDPTLLDLDDMALDPDAASKYGAKASNLALLRTVLPQENVVDGFGVPFAWFERFITQNSIREPGGSLLISYAEYVARLQADEELRTDPARLKTLLDALVEHAEDHGEIPPGLAKNAALRILETFGSTDVEVRCRSSSNFEDIVPFNGAGLYRSTSACAADSLDADSRGPSRCDPTSAEEETVERGFRRVWSSLYFPRAYGEREFWQAPHERAKMGILVTPTFEGEAANGVVLTGNPSVPGDQRFVINVQAGETSVVEPPPGVLAEKILLEMEDGSVAGVHRARPSSLLPEGEWVLSEGEARTIGELALQAESALGPRFESGLGEVLLDLEFKIVEDGGERRVVFKQVRPFLRDPGDVDNAFALVVPRGTEVCGVFRDNRTLATEYSLLARATFVTGRVELPTPGGSVEADLLVELLVGPDQARALPVGPGTLSSNVEEEWFAFVQSFLVGDSPLTLEMHFPYSWFEADGLGRRLVLDESFLSLKLDMSAEFAEEDIDFRSCTYDALPIYETIVTSADGDRVALRGRHLPALIGSGPENLTSANVTLSDSTRSQDDYWRLVFSADHHNWDRRYWVFLDPPVADAHVVELREANRFTREPAMLRLLDSDFRVLRDLPIASWDRSRVQDPEWPEFLRGDADNDGQVGIADAIGLIEYLFRGDRRLSCRDAADADDDGRVTVTDAVRVILHLFQGDGEDNELPPPGTFRCGKDLTADSLSCEYDVSVCF